MIHIPCLNIGVDYQEGKLSSYQGVFLACDGQEIYRSDTGNFQADYKKTYAEGRMICRGRIICLADSVFQYKTEEAKNKLRRTKFKNKIDGGLDHGSQRVKTKEIDQSGTSPFAEGSLAFEDGSPFEPENEGEEID